MNASDNANVWQYERMDEADSDATMSVTLGSDRPVRADGARTDDVPRVREVDEASTLKALADPIRLKILRVLMESGGLPVLSVKELAE
jgi:hypothetical protein